MDVSALTSSSNSKIAASATKLNDDFSQFLNLLTTQLQNQDPLNPMDSAEFTNQLVQFSQVEQQLRSNDTLDKLLTMQTLNLTALGVSFIGKNVEVTGRTFESNGTSPVPMGYLLPEAAEIGTLSIIDQTGAVVYSQRAETSAGRHEFIWNGKDNNGLTLPAGTYEIRVGATGAEGKALNVSTFVPGHVDGVESADDGSLLLTVGDMKVAITDVRKISEAPAL